MPKRPAYAFALSLGALVAVPDVLPLLDLCPLPVAAVVAACRPRGEAPHSTERQPAQGAERAPQTAAVMPGRVPLRGTVRVGPAVLRGQLFVRGA